MQEAFGRATSSLGPSRFKHSFLDETVRTHQTIMLAVAGLISLGVWLAVLFTLSPHRLLTYTAFFVPFWIFVTAFSACALQGLRDRLTLDHEVDIRSSIRQGAVFGSLLVINLAVAAAHRWSLITPLVTLTAASVFEVWSWARTPFGAAEDLA